MAAVNSFQNRRPLYDRTDHHAEDGFIHDDDFRTPLQQLTCPTCVGRIAESRTKRRRDAFGKHEEPRAIAAHSRLVAQAYTRSAEAEETLTDRLSPETAPT